MSNMFPGLTGVMTPEEAEAAIALAEKNPIIATRLQPGFHIEGVRIDDQKEKPTEPEVRHFETSSYNKIIPISLGRRRLAGNVIQCTSMVPRLVGTKEVLIEYEIPVYEDPYEPSRNDVDQPLCRS